MVQGEGAADSIVKGIQTLDAYGVDVMIVGRGGGSIEDLWAFNEEKVARAIFEAKTPIISAVGHETDTTIADFAADLRAPTPSAAAELAVADIRLLLDNLTGFRQKLRRSMDNRLQAMEQNLKYYRTKLELLSPQGRIREMRTRLLDDEGRIQSAMENQIYRARQNLDIYIERMKGLSPLDKLKQGFSYVENQEGKGVTSISQVKKGDTVNIRVTDGTLVASITGAEAAERSI